MSSSLIFGQLSQDNTAHVQLFYMLSRDGISQFSLSLASDSLSSKCIDL